MPIFEFTCKDCNLDFERLVKSNKSKTECPKCGSKKLEKKFSLFGMKSGDSFTSSVSSACGSCTPSPNACSICSKK